MSLKAPNSGNGSDVCALNLPEFILYFHIQPSVCLLGFILNILNCVVFSRPQFVGAAYKFMIALAIADAITLIVTFPIGFQRCKGFFDACLSPGFKQFRLLLSYYAAYFQFPISNASETASIFFTTMLTIERYMTMHKISYPGQKGLRCTPTEPGRCCCFCCCPDNPLARQDSKEPGDNEDDYADCGFGVLHTLLLPVMRACSLVRENVKLAIFKVTVLSIVLNIPMFFCQRIVQLEVALKNKSNSTNRMLKWRVDVTPFGRSRQYSVYTWLRTVFLQIIPLVFLCIINFYLIKFIRLANDRWRSKFHPKGKGILSGTSQAQVGETVTYDGEHSHSELGQPQSQRIIENSMISTNVKNMRRQAAQRKLTVLLVAIVILFLAGQLPQAFAFASIYQVFLRAFGISASSLSCSPPYRLYRAVTHCVCLVTYSANFFLYAALNNHFSQQLHVWFGCCSNFGLSRFLFNSRDRLRNGIFVNNIHVEKSNKRNVFTDVRSADFINNSKKDTHFIPMCTMSDVLPVGDTAVRQDEHTRIIPSYSEHVWRASVAVLSKESGRPVALARATLDRSNPTSINNMLINSSTSDALNKSTNIIEGDESAHVPLNTRSCDNFLGNKSLNTLQTGSQSMAASLSTTQHNLEPCDSHQHVKSRLEKYSLCSDDKIVYRVSSHSKRFWVKRWKTLAKHKIEKPKGTLALPKPCTKVADDKQFLFRFVSRVLTSDTSKKIDSHKLEFIFLSKGEDPGWLSPSILLEMSRAQQVCRGAELLPEHHLPGLTYHETHLDSMV